MVDERKIRDIRPVAFFTGVLATLVLVFCGFWFWCWIFPRLCWPCPDCDPCETCPECIECPAPAEIAAQIVLEDAHSGAWMTTENHWFLELIEEEREPDSDYSPPDVCSSSTAEPSCGPGYRAGDVRGVMFQLGPVSGHNMFAGLELTYDDGSVDELALEDFDWVDVNPADQACTIHPFHAYAMFNGLDSGGTAWAVATQCDTATMAGGSLPSCLRGRTLHAALQPDRLLTYWTQEGYTAEFVQPSGEDTGFVFHLADPVKADIWKNGCLQNSGESRTVTRIVIKYQTGDFDHGAFHDPPMDGGNIGP